MKTNTVNAILISLFILLTFACKDEVNDNEINNSQFKTTESDFFSVEYNYSDTIRLSQTGHGYVDIVVSSDDENVLNTHLNKYEYYLETMNVDKMNPKENQENNNNSDLLKSTSKCDFRDLNKIGVEIIGIGGSDVDGIDLKCRIKKNSTLSKIQKISVNPNPWYYEYSSSVHDYYGKVKHTNYASNGAYIPTTLVRYGYKKCILCKVITWADGEWRQLQSGYAYYYDINAFGYDGTHYIPGTNIYKLYTGVRSYSPDNFWVKFSNKQILDL